MDDQNYNEEEAYSIINCNLPKDAMELILVGLPVKSLLRFKCVAKSWYNYIRNPNFIKMHRNHQIYRIPSVIYSYQKKNVSCFRPDIFLLHLHPVLRNTEQYNSPIKQQLYLPFDGVKFECCCNGFICFMKNIYSSPKVILWNPANHRYKCISIPSECSKFTDLKLGFHQQSNEYKILKVPFQMLMDDESTKVAWVYTLSSGSWKTVSFTLPTLTGSSEPQIFVNGFMYWLTGREVEYVICFDLIKDEFKLIDIPDDRGFDCQLVHRKLMVLRGSLAMMVSVEDCTKNTEIWMLVNEKSSYSWTKKFILEPFSKKTMLLGMLNDHKLLFVVLKTLPYGLRQVYSYDLVTEKIEYFHVPMEQDIAWFVGVYGCYFESLELEDGSGRRY
ncbi:F-box/kelch-repeat protein At3g23880-like [Solanum tuberosum]|uniref:SFBBbeta protein n=1 Tax=Solanum tuberosum TaxID=4113 RepID=M1DHK2_SOLTU|nr:PREDICTED: F-box/kelch-repeat protein At3g23880-like [Solanum tuberosum]